MRIIIGFGRIIEIAGHGSASIWEGTFKNNLLSGIGRRIFVKPAPDYEYSYEFGQWDRGFFHGYGIRQDFLGTIIEGLFHKSRPKEGCEKDKISKAYHIDLDKYINK